MKKSPAKKVGEESFEDDSQSGVSEDSFDHVRFQAYGGEGQKAESQPVVITQNIRPTSGSGLARETVNDSPDQAVSLQKFKLTDGAPAVGTGSFGKVNDGTANVLKSEETRNSEVTRSTVTLQKSSGGVGLETPTLPSGPVNDIRVAPATGGESLKKQQRISDVSLVPELRKTEFKALETEITEPGKKTLTNQIVEPRIQQTELVKQNPETAGSEAIKQQAITKGSEAVTQSLASQREAVNNLAPAPIANEVSKSQVGSGGREITSSVTRDGVGSVGTQKLSESQSQISGGNNNNNNNNTMGSGVQKLSANVERPNVQAGSEGVGGVGEKTKTGESGSGNAQKFATELQKAPQNNAPLNNDRMVGGAGAPQSTERKSSEPLLKATPNEKQIVTQVGNPPPTLTHIQKNTPVERASGGGDKPISVEKVPNFTSAAAKIPPAEKIVTPEKIAQPEKATPLPRVAAAERTAPIEKAAPVERIIQTEKPLPIQKPVAVEKIAQAEKVAPVEKSIPVVKPAVVESSANNSKHTAQDKVVNAERNPIAEKLAEKSVAGNKTIPAEKQMVEARTHTLADAKPLDKLTASPKATEKSPTSVEKISTNRVIAEKAPAQIAAQEKVGTVVLKGHLANTERAGTTSEKANQQDKTAAGIRALMEIKAEAFRPNVEQAVNQTRIVAAREVLFGDIKPSPVTRIDESNKSFVNIRQNVIPGDIRPVQNTVKGSSELVAALHPVDRTYVGKSPDIIQVPPKDITFTVKPVVISDSRITGIKGSADLIPALFPIEHQTAKGGKESVINSSGHAFTKRPEIITSTTADTTGVESKRVLSSPKLVALLTSLAEGKAEIRRSPLERNQNVLELKSTKDRYVGGEFLLASLIVAAGMARKMPEKQPLPDTRDNNEIKKPDLIINKKSEFAPILDVKEHVTKSIGQLLESLQETALGGKKEPAPAVVQPFTQNLDFSIHDDFGKPLDIQGEQVSLESQNEEQDANSKSKPSALFRPIWLISKGETLVSIAEQQFGDGSIAWLIADLNPGKFVERNLDGKRVVEITSRQRLELPVSSDIVEFKRNRLAHHDAENIITIVTENQLDADAIAGSFKNFLGTVNGNEHPSKTTKLPQLDLVSSEKENTSKSYPMGGRFAPQFASIAAAVSLPLLLPQIDLSNGPTANNPVAATTQEIKVNSATLP